MNNNPLSFKRLTLGNWRQFREIEIEFHPRLTIITGANGAGKSTILHLLTRHFGYQRNLLSTPYTKDGRNFFSVSLFDFQKIKKFFGFRTTNAPPPTQNDIGTLTLTSGMAETIYVPTAQQTQYQLTFQPQNGIAGIHVDSHRPPTIYRHVPQIDTNPITENDIFHTLNSEFMGYFNSGSSSQGALYHIKKALISMNYFGYGNAGMVGRPELIRFYEGFQEKLRQILPKSLGFNKLIIRSPEVTLDTDSGEFIIDACSGGVIKIIEIVWQIYFFSQLEERFVVTMDEPENHLHPAMQQSFLQQLISAFPTAQFVVVTHSPFMISSVENSNIYVLRYEETEEIISDLGAVDQKPIKGSRVVSFHLDTVNRAGTAADILRDVLGVPATIPTWAESKVDNIIEEYKDQPISEQLLSMIYNRLESEGLVAKYPAVLKDLATRGNNAAID